MNKTSIVIAGLILGVAAVLMPGKAQAAYPDKPITFIVPFGAGSSFGALARKLSQRWEKELGVPFAVKNFPGSGGRRGSIRLFKSKNDGYTIGFAHFVPFQTDEFLRGKKTAVDYRKFAVILKLTHSRHFLFVNKKSPFKTFADLKKSGRTIKFAGTGIGAITWVEASAVGATVGFPVSFVLGYKKLASAALAVAKGDADGGLGSTHHFSGVANDVRPLIFLGANRDSHYPNVPSAKELGFIKLTNLGSPRTLAAPPGTPESKLKVIRAAARKAMADKKFRGWLTKTGYYPSPLGPKAFWKSLKVSAGIYKDLRPLLKKGKK